MAAHSCLTALKSLGGALTTVATAALKASLLTEEESEQKSDDEPPINPPFLFKPFHEDGPPTSPNELLHNLHFLFFPPTFSYSKSIIQKKTISWVVMYKYGFKVTYSKSSIISIKSSLS